VGGKGGAGLGKRQAVRDTFRHSYRQGTSSKGNRKHRYGGLASSLFAYGTAVLYAGDQYTDSATVVLALARGWHLAAPMAITFWGSYLLQLLVGVRTMGLLGAFFFVVGMNPEALAKNTFEDGRSFGNAIAVTKFFTENVPQSILAVLLARELVGSAQVLTYASVCLSMAIGLSRSSRLPRRVRLVV
jgi:hypothetical protein